MIDTTRYYKDPSKLIFELMQDTFKDKYTYFLGSPLALSAGSYPCIVVQPVGSNHSINGAPTGYDSVEEKIDIHVMQLQNVSAVSSGNQDTAIRNFQNAIEGRNHTTGFYMEGSLMYALRANLELYNPATNMPTAINHDIDIEYAITPESADKAVIEAIVTVTTSERIQVPDRIIG